VLGVPLRLRSLFGDCIIGMSTEGESEVKV